MNLQTPISQIPYIGQAYVKKLQKLNIKTAEDLIHHYPFRYNDFSIISKIEKVQLGETVTIQGKVLSMKNEYTKYGKQIQKAIVSDETGNLEVVWYNQPFLIKVIPVGENISLSGKVTSFGKKLVLDSPEYEIIKPITYNIEHRTLHTAGLVPVYRETRGLSSKWLRLRLAFLLPKLLEQIKEYLPEEIVNYNHLLDIKSALSSIHFPKDKKQEKKARERLAFDELFFIQLSSAIRKAEWGREVVSNKFQITDNRKQIREFYKKLPFKLTRAQRKCVGEILTDLGTPRPMNRLLQGDVGCGKTVVSAVAMYLTYLNGFQSALMTPTEILAFQHYETIKNMLGPFGLKIALLTRSRKTVFRNEPATSHQQPATIFIGTHALLNEKLKFEKLGLVVIDEQHRFGVEQRAKLRQKGINPHILTMTATPIPRSVALTLYGELDLSYIDEMPPGRQKVATWLVPPEKREAAYEWIRKQISENSENSVSQKISESVNQKSDSADTPIHRYTDTLKFSKLSGKSQAFIICPLIQESEHETMQSVKAATVEYEHLQKKVFSDFKVGLLHGRLKGKEKDKVLQDFRDGKLDILVATPVVEVGIDIPNAMIMLIEAAERFGLAQLHQLRGRVGRGEKQSYCLLFTQSDNEKTLKRLKSMEKMYNGAQLAELDLKLRGPGEIFGTRQHGFLNLKIASLTDYDLIEKAKKAASFILKKHSALSKFPLLKERIKKDTIAKVSPD